MVDCEAFARALRKAGVGFTCGVPDSLLANFCAFVADHSPPGRHLIAANEGAAVALATGHFLATGELGLVYLQNSGLGNAVNPLTSLADKEVYGVPLLLLVGWRGEPGEKDEPQHLKQGRITPQMLDVLEVPWRELPSGTEEAVACVAALAEQARRGQPCAILVRKGSFAPYESDAASPGDVLPLDREGVVRAVADAVGDAVVVATTGKLSRELFEHRVACGQDPGRDFLTVGSMGHASQIALAIALARPDRRVVCLDGDGSAIMHLGGLALIGSQAVANLTHVVVNNGAHDSVGGQPTAGFAIELAAVAQACGYRRTARVETPDALAAALAWAIIDDGPVFLEVRARRGARVDLGRPDRTPLENRRSFEAHLRR